MTRTATAAATPGSLGLMLQDRLAAEHRTLRQAQLVSDDVQAQISAAEIEDLLGLADRNDLCLAASA